MDRDRGGCRVNGQKSGEMFPLNWESGEMFPLNWGNWQPSNKI